jgi:hypothetical protein
MNRKWLFLGGVGLVSLYTLVGFLIAPALLKSQATGPIKIQGYLLVHFAPNRSEPGAAVENAKPQIKTNHHYEIFFRRMRKKDLSGLAEILTGHV